MANVVSQASAAMCYKPYLGCYGTLIVVCCGICQASAAVARPKCSVRDWQCSLQNVLFHAGGVFTSGVWPLLSNLEDHELRRLALALPATVLSSRADSTTKKYLGAYQRWKTWADARQGVPSFPVQEIHLVLYMQHLSESTECKAAVEEAVHALSWLHGLAGLQPFSESTLVKSTLEGLRRMLAKPKVRKEPVTADMLKAMVEAAGLAPSLTEVRLLAVCLVAFAGFM